MVTPDQLSVFLAYTKRFDRIYADMPNKLRTFGDIFNKSDLDSETRSVIVRYLNLCSEEHFLHTKGLVTDEVWEHWKRFMRLMFLKKATPIVWAENAQNYPMAFQELVKQFAEDAAKDKSAKGGKAARS